MNSPIRSKKFDGTAEDSTTKRRWKAEDIVFEINDPRG
jgi:hypothetical protein